MASKVEEAKALDALFKSLTKSAKAFGDALEKSLESKEMPKTIDGINKLEKEVEELNAATKELESTRKSQAASQAKLNSLRKGGQDQIIKTRMAIQSETKAIKDRIKQSQSLTPLLDKERKRLAAMQNQLAETALRTGASSKETQKLAKRTQFLNEKLLRAEKIGGRFQRQVGNYPKILGKGIIAFAGIGAGIELFRRGIANAINIAKDFEQSNANLASVLGVSRKEIGALTEDAKRLGAITSFTASQVSELQTEFAKLGFNEQEILNATEATLNLAAATGSDLGEAAAIAGATLGGFGLGAEETARVTDVMAKSFSTSALDIEKFKESMKDAAPAAKAVGIDVEKTTALLGTLANAGISGSKAGNALKAGFIELNAAGLTLDDGLEQIANSQDKLSTATALVGKRAATSFLVLADGTKDIAELEKGLRNAGGAAEKMANEQLDTLEGSLKILNSAWEGFVLGLLSGDSAFSSISRNIVGATTSLLGFLTASEDATEKSFESAKALQQEANESQNLLDEYENLVADGIEPTAEEKEKLEIITLKLRDSLGESVVAINAETGAFELNTDAVRAQIKAKRFAADAEASTIASRLKGVQEEIKLLQSQESISKREIKLRKESAKQLLGNIDLENLRRVEFTKSGNVINKLSRLTDEQREAVEAITEAEGRRNKAQTDIRSQQEEEADLIEKLKELNFDLNDVNALFNDTIEDQTNALENNTDATEDNSKAKQKAADEAFRVFVANEKRRIELLDEGIVKELEKEELRNKQSLRSAKKNNEDLELVELVHQKNKADIRDDFREKEFQAERDRLELNRKLNTKDGDEALKRAKELDEELKQIEKDRLKRERELTDAAIAIVESGFKKRTQVRIKALEEEEDGLKSQGEKLQDLADKGSEDAVKSLDLAQKREGEIRAEKEKALQREKQIEAGLTAFKVFAAKTEQGDKNALGSTITDISVLQAFIASLSSAYEGTIDTGNGGSVDNKGGFLAVNHPNERVVPKKDNQRMGGMSNDKLADVAEMYNKGLLLEHNQLPSIELKQQPYQSNAEVLAKYDEMISVMKSLPKKMPKGETSFDAFRRALLHTQKTGNNTETKGYLFD